MDTTIPVFLNKQEIRYRVAQISDLPPISGALQRLLEVVHSEVASVKELENIILYDQALTAKILRLANSSFYATRGSVRTVAQAIMLIGFDQVKSICLCVLLMQLCTDASVLKSNQRERLWKHAYATARIASDIARIKPWMSKELCLCPGITS